MIVGTRKLTILQHTHVHLGHTEVIEQDIPGLQICRKVGLPAASWIGIMDWYGNGSNEVQQY